MGYAEDVGNAYVESIEYPNGLFVDYYTELTPLYTRELREVTAETFPQFRKKWGDFLPEMQPDVKFEDLRHAIDTKPDEVEFNLMNYLLPITLLRINMKAKHYGVSEGLVIIQMANAKFMEKRAPEKDTNVEVGEAITSEKETVCEENTSTPSSSEDSPSESS